MWSCCVVVSGEEIEMGSVSLGEFTKSHFGLFTNDG